MFSTRYSETVQLCRQHSLDAVRTLVERLRDPDGRIAVVAANSIMERGWGKPKEARPEDNERVRIDLSSLTGPELAILLRLVESGRLKAIPADAPDAPGVATPTIEADVWERAAGVAREAKSAKATRSGRRRRA